MKWRLSSYFELLGSLRPCSFLAAVLESDVKFILNTFITIKLEIRLEAEALLNKFTQSFPYLFLVEPLLMHYCLILDRMHAELCAAYDSKSHDFMIDG